MDKIKTVHRWGRRIFAVSVTFVCICTTQFFGNPLPKTLIRTKWTQTSAWMIPLMNKLNHTNDTQVRYKGKLYLWRDTFKDVFLTIWYHLIYICSGLPMLFLNIEELRQEGQRTLDRTPAGHCSSRCVRWESCAKPGEHYMEHLYNSVTLNKLPHWQIALVFSSTFKQKCKNTYR